MTNSPATSSDDLIFDPSLGLPRYVLLDFETTGLDPESCEIIEVGAILVQGFTEISRYHSLVRPNGTIPKAISELTGITNEEVSTAPEIKQVALELAEFLGELPIVAHNSSLEQGFLDRHVSPHVSGIAFTVHNSIDPLALLLPDHSSHSMESMRKWAGVDSENAHRADKDCEDLNKVLRFAHDWSVANRAWIGVVVDQLLPGWWWGWFFDAALNSLETRPALLELLQRPYAGDLREMEKTDEARTLAAEIPLSKTTVDAALHGSSPMAMQGREFRFRESQSRMAENVREALEKSQRIAIEAPTGTGKSVAYLVPGVIAARETQAPLVVSTHSKTLQDQLYEKDLPLVRELLGGKPIAATTVKGQENYLCLRKLWAEIEFLPEPTSDANMEERYCAAFIVVLAKVSKLAELDRVSHYLRIRFAAMNSFVERVRSHHTTTKGPSCSFYKSCHYFDSARFAHQSEVVVANHSLVFHWPEHLPKLRNLVFDEAHHLEDQLTEAYSLELKETEIADTVDRLRARPQSRRSGDGPKIDRLLAGLTLSPGAAGEKTVEEFAQALQTRLTELSALVPAALARKGSRDTGGYEDFLDLSLFVNDPLFTGLQNLSAKIGDFHDFLANAVKTCLAGPMRTDPALDLIQLYVFRFAAYRETLVSAVAPEAKDFLRLAYWSPREATWRLKISPIEVRALGEEFFNERRSVVLTSATLAGGANATFVTDRVGVKLSKPFIHLPSPYPLAEQAVAFIPRDISAPGTPAHMDAIIGFTEQVARTLQGRTLLLMTANHRLKSAATQLRERLEKHGIEVFDSVSDRRAIDAFRSAEKAVLIGSERYGEGIDIPGRQLACVIVEKINEAMTRGPLAEARKARTKFSLFDYDFPVRMMWLKQRVGRLIRGSADRGAIVIFDPRYHGWGASSQNFVRTALAPIPIQGGTRDEILMKIEAMGI